MASSTQEPLFIEQHTYMYMYLRSVGAVNVRSAIISWLDPDRSTSQFDASNMTSES